MNRLQGNVAIVTGGTMGIGRACALRCAQEGAAVAVADISDDDRTVKEIRADGGQARHIVMDVSRRDDWQNLVATTIAEFGKVDLLANVAGVVNTLTPDNVIDLTDEAWDRVMNVDLRGVWLGMQAVLPHMISIGGGRIVNMASEAALKGCDDLAVYSAAKGGVLALTRQAALTYARENITINAICPGTIDTPILQIVGPDIRNACAQSHMIKRLGRPEEIAGMLAFLFSADGAFCTGMDYAVDGGWSVNGRNI
ncbi:MULTISPECIES: SDR family NAD(P)-dependent oxidoreductase [Protofrankia]|uniref:Short-chain dehydrogenase n=1 Tax=Protofrankia coriariae TaxID=1562887 RepID=A0ABR5F013_9ACTN|nr:MULTISPECIES: SDR family oxidoreductase [Protofrankia]KLL10056.1 short-chain dehydrogenase [Protofrankia coriariae]ONH32511.1 short-chain dehydrogenase [Protofrankia sp. BMG5.30]